MKHIAYFYTIIFLACLTISTKGQNYKGKYLEANYDETKVPTYTLPETLTTFNGQKISHTADWEKIRRPEIVDFFAQNMFGEVPTPSITQIKTSLKNRSN